MSNSKEFKEQFTKKPKSTPTVEEQLSELVVTSEAGAGLVKVAVNGHQHLVAVEIDPSILNHSDRTMLQDLIVAAHNLATHDVEQKAEVIIANAPDIRHLLQDIES